MSRGKKKTDALLKLAPYFSKNQESTYHDLLTLLSKKYLPFWFTANFKDTADLNKALVGYFQYYNDTDLCKSITSLRKVRNAIEHEKFVEDKLFSSALCAIETLYEFCNETKIISLLDILHIKFVQVMEEAHISVAKRSTISNSIKDDTNKTESQTSTNKVTDSKQKKEDSNEYMIATFAQLKNTQYHLRNGDEITMMDGKYEGTICKFFRWNGNNCFVFLPDETLPKSMVIHRKVKLNITKKIRDTNTDQSDTKEPILETERDRYVCQSQSLNMLLRPISQEKTFADAVKG